jgi:alpha-L-fucosidase 2
MPDGGVVNEHIVLNDITLWSGGPQDADLPGAYEYLDTIQHLLFAGKNVEAQEVMATLIGRGDEGTGWSLAWKMNLWARLHDGDHAFLILQRLLKLVRATKMNFTNGGGTYANLFCAHPPYQIDGNFGGSAGIAEMLVQSQDSTIEFLPALPRAWKAGQFAGLCVRGGAQVAAKWSDQQVREATITATTTHTFVIKKPKAAKNVQIKKNNKISNTSNDTIRVNMHPGETVKFVFEV